MAHNESAQRALLAWVNALPIATVVGSFEDLRDGVVLAKVLADIDPTLSHASAPKLSHIVGSLFAYIHDHCDDLSPLLETPGLQSFMTKGQGSLPELVATFLMAAVQGPARMRYLHDIPAKFDADTQLGLQRIIEERLMRIANVQDGVEEAGPAVFDTALDHERLLGELNTRKLDLESENSELKRKMAVLEKSADRMRENFNRMQDEFLSAQKQLQVIASKGDSAAMVDALKRDIQDRDELIAVQEVSLETLRSTREQAEAEVAKLRPSAEELLTVQDLLRVAERENTKLTKANAELEKKANTAEHYRRKLESARTYELEVAELTRVNDELQEELRDFAATKRRDALNTQRIADFQRFTTQHESEIYELSMQKMNLTDINVQLVNKLQTLELNLANAEDRHEPRTPDVPSTPRTASLQVTLDSELEGSEDDDEKSIIPALQAEIAALKKTAALPRDDAALHAQISYLEQTNRMLSDKTSKQFEDLVITQKHVQALMENATSSASESYAQLLRSTQAKAIAFETLQKQNEENVAALKQAQREVSEARTNLAVVGQAEREALDSLRKAHGFMASTFDLERKNLQSRLDMIDAEFRQQKSHLVDALIRKDELQRQQIAGQQAFDNQHQKAGTSSEAELLVQQASEVATLQERVRNLTESGVDPEAKAILEEENFNLKRENTMMTSAWYDLTRRLQSNNVTLPRRAEPRSWLNKQRQAVNPSSRR